MCGSLAEQMAQDAEGATKFVRVQVVGARTQAEARIAAARGGQQPARAVLAQRRRRLLGSCALGAGRERCVHRPGTVDIAYNDVTVCRDGVACAHDAVALAEHMGGREIDLRCDLHLAHGEATVLTTDLSHAYIDENRRTS